MTKLLLGLLIAVSASTTINATPFVWDDTDSFSPGVTLASIGSSDSGNLNIKTQDSDGIQDIVGFRPGLDTVTAAVVKFSFTIRGFSAPVSVKFDLDSGT